MHLRNSRLYVVCFRFPSFKKRVFGFFSFKNLQETIVAEILLSDGIVQEFFRHSLLPVDNSSPSDIVSGTVAFLGKFYNLMNRSQGF